MNRHTTGDEIRALFKKLRERIPGLVLRTSIIAGLPGEGGAEFEELCEFLREARIERAGVFPFSPEEGTPAGTMEHVPAEEAQRRADIIMDIQAGIMDDYCDSLIGTVQPVLYERDDGELGGKVGRSRMDSPDIDGLVIFTGDAEPGDIINVRITAAEDGNLIGEEVSE
jgi:ribosomal protein S12 methylthiotransferase